MTAFYNERDPYAAQWLRNLIAAGHIAPGDVDERSIWDVKPDDLKPYTQCHFFAGIGVWSHALRASGWDDDRRIWTGSCPCQPFSAAGKGAGFDDERHLWPVWFQLIAQCRPPIVIGEQVASKDGLSWLDLVSSDMENAGYALGASDLCAAGFSGAHIRQRLYFVGVDNSASPRHERTVEGPESATRDETRLRLFSAGRGASRMDDDDDARSQGHAGDGGATGREGPKRPVTKAGVPCRMADRNGGGCDRVEDGEGRFNNGEAARRLESDRSFEYGSEAYRDRPAHAPMLGRNPVDWLYCRDGRWRPVEPGTFPLAHAAPARVGRLRAYGNALDAETATEFVMAVMESI